MENQITIRFQGDGNIKVQTLTDFLDSYKQLLYQINTNLGYAPDDLVIEVSPPENGSFKIKLSPKYQNAILKAAGTIVASTLSGLLVYHLTQPTQPATIEQIETILEEKGITDKDLPKNIRNLYHNSGANQIINQTFIIVDGDEKITGLTIDQDETEVINIPKARIKEFILDSLEIEEPDQPKEDVLTNEAILIIKTIHFEGNAKWAFIFGGYPIKAMIRDGKFIERLNNEPFRKGDSLKVILSRKRHFDEDLQTYLVDQSSYSIDKVLEHTSKGDNSNQLAIE
jgi:hypothetical protein